MNRGIAVAMAANVVWGLAPIYWRLVDDVPAGDIVLFRILATALFLLGLHLARRSLRSLDRVRRTPGVTRAMALSGALVAANWLGFVYAVTNERVLEASLGYFMNPLVSVALGVMILGERLRPVQTTALLLAVVGVVVLTIDVGRPPWISFLLAGSFGLYGLIRKTAAIESLDGLSLEVAMLAPVALVVMIARAAGGDGVLGWSVPWRDLWLLGAGVLTAIGSGDRDFFQTNKKRYDAEIAAPAKASRLRVRDGPRRPGSMALGGRRGRRCRPRRGDRITPAGP